MQTSQIKLGIVGVAGLLAPLWWTWSVSQLTYLIHVASGSAEQPSRALFVASVYGSSLVVGLAAGAIIAILAASVPLKGWLVFFGLLVVSSLALGIFFGALAEVLGSFFGSIGNWFFFSGSLLLPLVVQVRQRAV